MVLLLGGAGDLFPQCPKKVSGEAMTLRNFREKYYEWALEQALREASSAFPGLRAVRGSLAMKSLTALQRFSQPIQERLVEALVARRHQRERTSEQETLLAEFDSIRRAELTSASDADSLKLPADRKLLRRILRQQGPPFLGEPLPGTGSNEMHFRLEHAGSKLTTLVDIGGRFRQLEYNQVIWLSEERQPASEVPISFMAWLGLASTTTWDILAAGEEESAVRLLREFCSRFIDALPRLLGNS